MGGNLCGALYLRNQQKARRTEKAAKSPPHSQNRPIYPISSVTQAQEKKMTS